jgi:hypothetical protein
MSEPQLKRGGGPNFGTRWPSKKELDYLIDTDQFDRFNERMQDRTIENLLYDAQQRKSLEHLTVADVPAIPKEALRRIAVFMDVRQVLDIAKNNIIFARLTTLENEFIHGRITILCLDF